MKNTPFDKKLRHLAPKLPQSEVPDGLESRTLSRLKQADVPQKGNLTMKTLILSLLAITTLTATSVALWQRETQTRPVPLESIPPRRGPVLLHLVDTEGKPLPGAEVSLWFNNFQKKPSANGQKPSDPFPVDPFSAAPPKHVEPRLMSAPPTFSPVGTADEKGDLLVTDTRFTHYIARFDESRMNASGTLPTSDKEYTIVLSETPPNTITGRFVNELDGKPLVGLKLALYAANAPAPQEVITDLKGYFICWIAPGTEYRLVLDQKGYTPYEMGGIRIREGQCRTLGTIQHTAQQPISR
jgi:hypothetical protein